MYTISIVNGDFDFDVYGRVRTVNGTNKAAQDLGEMLQSRMDSRRGYGTRLEVGHVGYLDQTSWIRGELQDTVVRFQQIQRKAGVTDNAELVTGIRDLSVTSDGAGGYSWNLKVTVNGGKSVTSYNGVVGRRLTALLRSGSAQVPASSPNIPAQTQGDESLVQAQSRITPRANWGPALPAFVWKSPELPLPGAAITATVTPADIFAPTSVTVVPTIPATPKPVHTVSFLISGVTVGQTSTAPYSIVLQNIPAGTTTITIVASSIDGIVVGGGSVQVSLESYPTDRIWRGGRGAIDPAQYKFAQPWPFKSGTGVGEYAVGGKGAITPTNYQFRDGTYAEAP